MIPRCKKKEMRFSYRLGHRFLYLHEGRVKSSLKPFDVKRVRILLNIGVIYISTADERDVGFVSELKAFTDLVRKEGNWFLSEHWDRLLGAKLDIIRMRQRWGSNYYPINFFLVL